jgi:type VI secretion system protein ImpK
MKFATAQPTHDLLPVALRDAARTVVALRSANPPSQEVLREDSDAQVASLREELQRRGHPQDVIDDALYAHCALIDDAGEELLRRMGQRLREAKPVLPLLAIFAVVLGLGFKGRYALNEAEARMKLIGSIDERLARATSGSADRNAPDRSGPLVVNPSRSRRRPLSPLAWVFVACIAAGLVWLAIDRWLMSSIAGMAN